MVQYNTKLFFIQHGHETENFYLDETKNFILLFWCIQGNVGVWILTLNVTESSNFIFLGFMRFHFSHKDLHYCEVVTVKSIVKRLAFGRPKYAWLAQTFPLSFPLPNSSLHLLPSPHPPFLPVPLFSSLAIPFTTATHAPTWSFVGHCLYTVAIALIPVATCSSAYVPVL